MHSIDQSADTSMSALCKACGACCSTSKDWPRFTLESDTDIDRIPATLIDDRQAAMRCSGDRCAALTGTVGIMTACSIYEIRPIVCRDCLPGDDACQIARTAHSLSRLVAVPVASMTRR
jgi:Fe-S-cluster containining protein